jgi:hypothetical protein
MQCVKECIRRWPSNVLRTFLKTNPPQNVQAANEVIDIALATAMHATRCAVSRSLGISPGAMAFHRDMLLNIPVIADLLAIQTKRQTLIDENLRRVNLKRRQYDYAIGDMVMIKEVVPNKLEEKTIGRTISCCASTHPWQELDYPTTAACNRKIEYPKSDPLSTTTTKTKQRRY